MTTEPVASAGLEVRETAGVMALYLTGEWIVSQAAIVDSALNRIHFGHVSRLDLDLARLSRLDTAGAWLIHRTRRTAEGYGAIVSVANTKPNHQTLLKAVAERERPPATHPEHPHFVIAVLERMGATLEGVWETTKEAVAFLGLLLETMGRAIVQPWRLRGTSTVYHMEQSGLNAVPIVSLMSFLVGAVLAFQGSTQLRKFGGEVFTVNLVGISFLREVGILLTAILVAGRSGSAFTAQIGSMKLREEIDAMRTLGLNPMEVLVVPRVLALILMLPILGFISGMMGLAGGLLILWLTMGMSPWAYAERVYDAVSMWSFWVGMIKAPVFGLLIGLIGCYEGMKVEGSAESVGQRTTQSVVEGIFIVIVADAMFSILFEIVGV
jgi:phospholipid/cholesterol/gamma-HCH transport system permease protein